MAHDLRAKTCRLGKYSSFQARPLNRLLPRFSRISLLACCLLLLPFVARSQDGRFEVQNTSTFLEDGVYYVTAWLDYTLSAEALEALESGVALTFELQIELTRTRRFWVDPEIATL
ncbi:MAG: DUF4390 domain-containing protein, partial [Pseudomonadota bacterium]|nr:DUF4390 domain-containing protein [Pseudomonadota bacterium]